MEHTAFKDRFAGKIAIVTGGASGIGRTITAELLKEGASVVFTGISDAGEATLAEFRDAGFAATFMRGDHADDAFCEAVVAGAVEAHGRVDYLVNNAFSFTATGLNSTTEDWMRSFTAGPLAYARMVQHVVPAMEQAGRGAIVNVSSISAHIAQADRWTYNSAKGAVDQLTKCQALDLAPFDIRVNSVDPGWIWSNETDKAADQDGGGREKWGPIWGEFHMLRRVGEAIEVARPALFLLSDDASFITGTNLVIDGGYMAMGPERHGESSIMAGSA